jgi:hypothetical protein
MSHHWVARHWAVPILRRLELMWQCSLPMYRVSVGAGHREQQLSVWPRSRHSLTALPLLADVGLPGFSRPGRSWRTSTSFTTTREPDQHTLQLHDSSAAPLPQAPATQHDNSPSPYRMEAWRSLTVPGLVTELHQQVCTAGTESCGLSISQCDDTAGHDNYVADTMPEDDTGVPSQTGASRYSMETSATAAFAAQDAAAQELGRAASLTINPVQEVVSQGRKRGGCFMRDAIHHPRTLVRLSGGMSSICRSHVQACQDRQHWKMGPPSLELLAQLGSRRESTAPPAASHHRCQPARRH